MNVGLVICANHLRLIKLNWVEFLISIAPFLDLRFMSQILHENEISYKNLNL